MSELCLSSKSKHSVKSQAGMTLLELMIAMMIGLFLMAGVSTTYVSSKSSSVLRDQLSLLNDNGRIAIEILTNTLEHTGYKSVELDVLENPFITDNSRVNAVACATGITSVVDPTILETVADNDTTGDVIGVVYLGDDDLNIDCTGKELPVMCRTENSAVSEAHEIYNSFYIDSDENLQCAGSRNADSVTISEGVENMQILYGLDIDNNAGVDRYVNATDVEAAGDWSAVVSLKIAILVRSPLEVKNESESLTFSLLDVPVTTNNDKYHRAVFNTTISLRNQSL